MSVFGSPKPPAIQVPRPDPESLRLKAEEESKRKRRATFQASLLRTQAPADVLGG